MAFTLGPAPSSPVQVVKSRLMNLSAQQCWLTAGLAGSQVPAVPTTSRMLLLQLGQGTRS